jgi:ribonuclease HI
VWATVPPAVVPQLVAICRDALLLYHTTDDPAVKEAIIRDLHLVPNALLRKVRGEHGKATTRLANRLSSPHHSLFRNLPRPVAAPAAAAAVVVAAAPAIHVWTDGSCSASIASRKGVTGCGYVVVDRTQQPEAEVARASTHLGSGTGNTAELSAILLALEAFADRPLVPLVFHVDSQYAIGACGVNRVSVTNAPLVFHVRALLARRQPRAIFKKADAHIGIRHNETADALAKEGRLNDDAAHAIPTNSWLVTKTALPRTPSRHAPSAPVSSSPTVSSSPSSSSSSSHSSSPAPSSSSSLLSSHSSVPSSTFSSPEPAPRPLASLDDECMSACDAEEEAASLRRTVHRAVELARAGHLQAIADADAAGCARSRH